MRTNKELGYLSDYWYVEKNVKKLHLFLRYWPIRTFGFQVRFKGKQFTFWGWQGLYRKSVFVYKGYPPETSIYQGFLKYWHGGLLLCGFMYSWRVWQ